MCFDAALATAAQQIRISFYKELIIGFQYYLTDSKSCAICTTITKYLYMR